MQEKTSEIIIEKCQEKTEPLFKEKTELTTEIISEIKTESLSEEKTELPFEEEREGKLDRIECELSSLSSMIAKMSDDLSNRKKEFIVANKKKDIVRTLDEVIFNIDITLKTLDSCLLDLNEVYVYYEHTPFISEISEIRKISKEISTIKCEIIRSKERINKERYMKINSSDVAKYFNMR